ncbi:haloacid dehalogenase [Mycena floridula]|nr:haloacid dehalogenase [Mycena floridula]
MEDIEAVIFDVFGTVVDWHGSVTKELISLGKRLGFTESPEDWAAFATQWRRGYLTNTFKISQGEMQGTLNVDILHRQILEELLQSTQWQHLAPSLNDNERSHLNLVWHRLNGWPDAVQGLYEMKKHAIIATLSNGNVRLLVDMAKHADLPWDTVFSSELFGPYKPAPQPYLGALRHLSLSETPGKCAMVACHLFDLRAAATHGITTVYIPRGDDDLSIGEVKSKAEGGEVDFVVKSFIEVAQLLKK